MKHSPEKTIGFEYEHEGKRYMFDVLAQTRQEAEGRVANMAHAICVGEICKLESIQDDRSSDAQATSC